MGKFCLVELGLGKQHKLTAESTASALVLQPKNPRPVFGQLANGRGDSGHVQRHGEPKRTAVSAIDLLDTLTDK
jgi:hypothetical protein